MESRYNPELFFRLVIQARVGIKIKRGVLRVFLGRVLVALCKLSAQPEVLAGVLWREESGLGSKIEESS